MKTTNRILGLFFMVLTLLSCSKEGGDDNGLFGDGLLLVESKVDGKTKARYAYDNQNRLTTLYTHNDDGVQETTVTYMYDNNNRLIRTEMVNSDGEIEYSETYTYESDNRPVSSTTIFGQDIENAITTTYTYSTNKLVEKMSIPGGYTSETHYTTDSKGNLVQIETFSEGQKVTTTEFGDYDDKNAAGRSSNPYAWKFNSPNNHRSEKATTTYVAGNMDRTLKYTYNNDGYPTKMEIHNREDNALIETHTYSYIGTN